MTGEVTLRGKVLPVGGIKDKILAAYRAGIREVALPRHNEKDIIEIPEEVRKETTFHLLEHVDQLLEIALIGYDPKTFSDDVPPTQDTGEPEVTTSA